MGLKLVRIGRGLPPPCPLAPALHTLPPGATSLVEPALSLLHTLPRPWPPTPHSCWNREPALRCTDRNHTRQCPHEHAAIIQCWSREARCLTYSHRTNHLTALAVEGVEGAARVKAINGVAAHDR